MRVLLAGAGGMIGSAVTSQLSANGHETIRLVRREPGANEVRWDPESGTIDTAGLEGMDAVVHLASMPWPLRWTDAAKKRIRANRLAANGLLAEALAGCARRPAALVFASGMGYYAPAGDEIITEETPSGTSFLSLLQRDGEEAIGPARRAGIRVVALRITPVLAKAGIERGLSQAGDGRQWTSWVSLAELAGIVEYALVTETLAGPVNAVSPHPVRNAAFAAACARALGKKPGFTMPAFLLRLLLGEMAEEFMLASRRMEPRKLLASGFRFRFPELETAIEHELAATA